eukprot:scaffold132983_cov34-Tisochrysis_lutea.AAC.1
MFGLAASGAPASIACSGIGPCRPKVWHAEAMSEKQATRRLDRCLVSVSSRCIWTWVVKVMRSWIECVAWVVEWDGVSLTASQSRHLCSAVLLATEALRLLICRKSVGTGRDFF